MPLYRSYSDGAAFYPHPGINLSGPDGYAVPINGPNHISAGMFFRIGPREADSGSTIEALIEVYILPCDQ